MATLKDLVPFIKGPNAVAECDRIIFLDITGQKKLEYEITKDSQQELEAYFNAYGNVAIFAVIPACFTWPRSVDCFVIQLASKNIPTIMTVAELGRYD